MKIKSKNGAPAEMEVKESPAFEVKSVDEEQRIVEGYASTWDQDEVGDIVMPGAFQKSLSERYPAGKIKVLRDHQHPIGIPVEMYEDERGLYVRAKISKTPMGDETLQLAKDGVISSFSIGFGIPRGKSDYSEDMAIRYIREVKLFEFSLVTFPANEEAVLTGVKERANVQESEPKSGDADHSDEEALATTDVGEPQEKGDPQAVEELKQSLEELRNFARLRLY